MWVEREGGTDMITIIIIGPFQHITSSFRSHQYASWKWRARGGAVCMV